MAGSLNKVCLLGNVGKDPEIRSTQGGQRVASFSIATSETWRDKGSGEKREKTDWHNIVVFQDGLVKVIEDYVHKGSKIYVEGKLQTRKWEDREGQTRYSTEVVLPQFGATLILLSDGKGKGAERREAGGYEEDYDPARHQTGTGSAPARGDLDDEIPF